MKLVFLKGSKIGSSITLNAGNSYRVGRDTACEIKVPEGDVSAIHLKLTVDQSGALILENVTTHQKTTFVNEVPVGSGEKRPIAAGDEIALGFSRSVVFTLNPEELDGKTRFQGQVSSVPPSVAGETGYLGPVSDAPTNYQAKSAVAAVSTGSINNAATPEIASESKAPDAAPSELVIARNDGYGEVDPLSVAKVESVAVPKVVGGRGTSRGKSTKWLLFSLLMFSAAFALFVLQIYPVLSQRGSKDQDNDKPTLCWYQGETNVVTCVEKMRKCFEGNDSCEWKKGVLWLEGAVVAKKKEKKERLSVGDAKGDDIRQNDWNDIRQKILGLAADASGDEKSCESVRTTLMKLGLNIRLNINK